MMIITISQQRVSKKNNMYIYNSPNLTFDLKPQINCFHAGGY